MGSSSVRKRKRGSGNRDALAPIKRAEAFPVQGGDILPITRKSWYERIGEDGYQRGASRRAS